jgi:hypothetical protein
LHCILYGLIAESHKMNNSETTINKYLHNCPVIGPETRLPFSTTLDSNNEFVLFRQRKCPFCSQAAGEPEYARGVSPRENGYAIDMSIVERVK